MILKDRVDLETSSDSGATWAPVGTFPAEVRALGSDEQISAGRDAVITRYRVLLSRRAPLGAGSLHVRAVWRDHGPTGEGSVGRYLVMDGGVSQHTRNGRVVFLSFVTKSVLG